MPGYLDRLRRLERSQRRQRIEEVLLARLTSIDDQPVVGSLLVHLGCDGFRVTLMTYDEPEFAAGQASLQFTYHLQDGSEGPGLVDRDEIRGSGLATIDDQGVVHLSEVDAEIFQMRSDDEPRE